MTDIHIRTQGRAGRITLNRPKALNALTWDMVLQIETAIDAWRNDNAVALVLIEGMGEKAFCAGGDIADMYASGQRGDLDYGRRFWADEYRLNHKLATYPKPIVSFLQGFTMGGGVGVGCHASDRVLCESSQIAMPECAIGLAPDVGGTYLLARAPGMLGTYLGLTGDRMDAGDALFCGFGDHFVPSADWDDLKSTLVASGEVSAIAAVRSLAPESRLADWQTDIDAHFDRDTLAGIMQGLPNPLPAPLAHATKLMGRNSPLAMGAAVKIIQAVRNAPSVATALRNEYRFTYRAVGQSDFIEGIRAAIIDKDRSPKWKHKTWADLPEADTDAMIAPLGADELKLEDTP